MIDILILTCAVAMAAEINRGPAQDDAGRSYEMADRELAVNTRDNSPDLDLPEAQRIR